MRGMTTRSVIRVSVNSGAEPWKMFLLAVAAIGFPVCQQRQGQAATFQTLHTFSGGADGQLPVANLTIVGSQVFGTTPSGGAPSGGGTGVGVVFSMNPDGSGFQEPHTFGNGPYPDAANPYAGVTASNSKLFGTTKSGGQYGYGAVYSVSPNGSSYGVLHAFTNGSDGQNPSAGLTSVGSVLYGTTDSTIFSINNDGANFQSLYTFGSGSAGGRPQSLTAVGSTLYGTLAAGAANGFGEVFSINLDGSNFRVLHAFAGSQGGDGGNAYGGVIAVGNTLYGTTQNGGSTGNNAGTVYSIGLDGSNYQVLHNFNVVTGGSKPQAGLTLVGSTLFGTTVGPDNQAGGTVFSMNLDGSIYQVLHTFTGGSDGKNPIGGLTAGGSTLFGTTNAGGSGSGTVYSITVPEPSTSVLLAIGCAVGLLGAIVRPRPQLQSLDTSSP